MAITVKHNKVSLIPDSGDNSLVEPSDWNADHVLTGTIPISNGGTGASTANDGFNALAPTQTGNSGKYLTTDGTNTSWAVNPLGTVTSVAASGGTGISVSGSPITTSGTLTITNTAPDQTVAIASGTGISVTGTYPSFTVTNTSPSLGGDVVGPASATDNAIARFDTTTGKLLQNSVVTVSDTGAATGFTTLAASTSVTTPIVQASNSGGLALKNSGGTTQMSVGAGGGDNMSINVSTNLNGTNAQIDISPTGTGHVHIKPTGVNSVEIAPTFVGEMDNITIGSITPAAGSFTNLSVTGTTSFDGSQGTSGQVLTSAGIGATPTWTTPTTGTVTSVTGTSPVVSSGGNTPAISMPAATASVNGYLTSTDWTTFNNKGSGSVTSVALTAPSIFTVTGSPITSSGTLALTYSGTALPILNGGTGQTTANAAFNALAPSQTSNSGKYLTTNGTDTSWASLGNAYSRTSFTATASQTTFTVSYTVGLVQVYVNGVLLNGADYTATNGTSVVLAVACNVGDIVEALAFSSFSVASTVSSFSGGTTGLTPSTGTTGNVTLGGTLAVANGGTGVTTSTGSGNLVLSTSPTLVTPVLGTPSSVNLTNATNVPVNQATGTLAVANGGTGVTTSTGSGSVVLGTSPTIATPTITSLYGQNSNLVTTPYRDSGLVPGELIYRLNSAVAGADSTATQSAFGVGVTVSGSTVYQFEAQYILSKTAGTTSHNMSFLFGGTATVNNIAYSATRWLNNTSFANGGTGIGLLFQTASASTVQTAQANAGVYLYFLIKGTVSINAGGTFIPQYVLSVAPGGAYTMATGSYFKLSPMSASGANTSIGTWA